MDPVQAQKKQLLLKNQYLYDKEMADESGMVSYLSEEHLAAYDTAAPEEQANAVWVRQKLRDMMLVDVTTAAELKEEYSDVWDEAQAEKQRLQTDASRTGMDKAKNDLMGKKKKAAKAKLKKIDDAKASLERGRFVRDKQQRYTNLYSESDVVFKQKRTEMQTVRQREYERAQQIRRQRILAAGGSEEDFQKDLALERSKIDYAMKTHMITITDDMTKEQRAHAEQVNAEVYEYYNRLKSQELQLEAKYDSNEGAFQQRTALYLLKPGVQAITPLISRYKQEYPDISEGEVLRTDVFRDCCRWISPINHAHEANTEEMHTAITHLKTLQDIRMSGNLGDPNVAAEAVRYIHDKMNLAILETERLRESAPSLFGNDPDYSDLIQHAEEINDMYKKSQSVEGIAQAIVTCKPYMDTLDPATQQQLKEKWAYLAAAMSKYTELFSRGRNCDKIVRDGAFPGDGYPESLKSFDEKFDANKEGADAFFAGKEATRKAQVEAQQKAQQKAQQQ